MSLNENPPPTHLHAVIPAELAGLRLDVVLTTLWPHYSRTRFKTWLEHGQIKVNQHLAKAKNKVLGGELIEVTATLPQEEKWSKQALPLTIIYEDDALIIINKPAGVVTHPAPGHYEGTLVNALLHHCPALQHVPRAGLIHRLDKDTSGLLVVAKTIIAHHALVKALQAREIKRQYEAIVKGVLTGGGRIETPMGRHPKDRKRMAVRTQGKIAITHYRILTRFRSYTHIEVQLETGRTHQIRVHMAHIHHPLVGDPVYGSSALTKGINEPTRCALMQFKRQALHAKRLGFIHPLTQTYCEWIAPLPEDMQHLLNVLAGENR